MLYCIIYNVYYRPNHTYIVYYTGITKQSKKTKIPASVKLHYLNSQ